MAIQCIFVHSPISPGRIFRILLIKNESGPCSQKHLPTATQNIFNVSHSLPISTLDLPTLPSTVLHVFHRITVPMSPPSSITIRKASNIWQFKRIIIVKVKLSDQIAATRVSILVIVWNIVFVGEVEAEELLLRRVKSITGWKCRSQIRFAKLRLSHEWERREC